MTDRSLPPEQTERFERLAWPLLPVLLRLARILTHNDAQAEDLVQETMFKAMRFMDSYQDGTDVRAWLMTILRRTHIDMGRADRRRVSAVSLDAVGPDLADDLPTEPGHLDERWSEPAQLLDRFEDQAVVEALRQLPAELCWTLLLVDVEQMPHGDAAGVLGVPVGTVKSRVYRGRRMLRDRLMLVAEKRGWVALKETAG